MNIPRLAAYPRCSEIKEEAIRLGVPIKPLIRERLKVWHRRFSVDPSLAAAADRQTRQNLTKLLSGGTHSIALFMIRMGSIRNAVFAPELKTGDLRTSHCVDILLSISKLAYSRMGVLFIYSSRQ